jgi:hypothetical protein
VKKLTLILLMFCAFLIKAQQNLILNGSFELNTFNSCTYDADCNQFTTNMVNISGIPNGTYNIDILNNNCILNGTQWGGGSQSGTWFIGAQFGGGSVEMFSFNLNENLIIDTYYKLSFYTKIAPPYPITLATYQTTDIVIGGSDYEDYFGNTICTIPQPDTSLWQLREYIFYNTNPYSFLTVSGSMANGWGYLFLDNFVLEKVTVNAIYETNNNRQLLKIVDILGKESSSNAKGLLFYIYSDGTVEKRIVIE